LPKSKAAPVLSHHPSMVHFRTVPEFISLKEVLETMDAGQPFSIAFVTCDQRKQTGGQLIEIEKAYKSGHIFPEERKRMQDIQPASQMIGKAPNHYQNSTRNLLIAKNSEIRKVHIRLIRKFNGKTVL
jgi:hypothetical protein